MQVWDRGAASYRKIDLVAVSAWYTKSNVHFCSDAKYHKILTQQTLNKFYIFPYSRVGHGVSLR